jgi:TusA-related sulfurtransferase
MSYCTQENFVNDSADYFLDITDEICPMTFVKTKLQIEQMAGGEILEIRLNAGEPIANVPRSVREGGHEVLSLEPENVPDGIHRLFVRKNSPAV